MNIHFLETLYLHRITKITLNLSQIRNLFVSIVKQANSIQLHCYGSNNILLATHTIQKTECIK